MGHMSILKAVPVTQLDQLLVTCWAEILSNTIGLDVQKE